MNTTTQTATLRASAAFSTVTVDEAEGIIRNAAVMTVGPAKGYGFQLDTESLNTLLSAINAKGGSVKVRFRHPTDINAEDLGTDVAILRNVRIEGDSVRGDVHLADHADDMPYVGNARKYLLSKARNDPTGFGLSAVIAFDPVEIIKPDGTKAVAARIKDVVAVDFVGDPAANPNGLLSRGPNMFDPTKHGAKLRAKFSIPNASDELLGKLYEVLTDDDKMSLMADPEAPKAEEPKPEAAKMSAKSDPDIVALESKRVAGIVSLASQYAKFGVTDEHAKAALAAGESVEAAMKRFQGVANSYTAPGLTPAMIAVGEDRSRAAQREAIPQALMLRAGVSLGKDAKPHELATKFASLRLTDMFRNVLLSRGVSDAQWMTGSKIAELITSRSARLATAQLAQSTSDFDNLLADAANKTLRIGYEELPKTWSLWAKRGTNPDFKAGNRILMSEIGTPTERREGADFVYNTITDNKETVTLTEYVTGVKLTRRAIINDDLNAFNDIQSRMGAAFARLEDVLAYSVLTANAALADTGLLFNSTAVTTAGGHANLATGSGVAGSPTVATLQATSRLMRVQRGIKGDSYLNLEPRVLIVPVALQVTAAQLVGSNVDPSRSNATPNPYFNALTVVSHPLLDANSTSRWYLAADPRQVDTVEVCFLQDEPAPVIKTETDFDTDDVKFAGRHTITAKAIDFRGLVRNGA